jgi:hypothetical protein
MNARHNDFPNALLGTAMIFENNQQLWLSDVIQSPKFCNLLYGLRQDAGRGEEIIMKLQKLIRRRIETMMPKNFPKFA